MKNARLWHSWYLVGWAVALGGVLGWEGYAYLSYLRGRRTYPTLSEIIVTGLGAKRASAVTAILAAVLCWHWWDVENEIARRVAARRRNAIAAKLN